MTAHALTDTSVELPASKARAWLRRPIVVALIAVLVAAAGVAWLSAPRSSETTDNAYVQADSSVVAPKVRGIVAEVLVQHDQPVHKGDVLVRIDPEEFDARVAAARAGVQHAQAAIMVARAALSTLNAELQLAASNVRAAETAIRAADAQYTLAQADRARFEALVRSGAASARDSERYRTAEATARADADRQRAARDASRDQQTVTQAKRQTLLANLAQAEASEATAQAALELSLQDQRSTLVRAPIDGVAGDRHVEPGDYVQPGSRLLTVVPMNALYVVANFKETQVERMAVGQSAQVAVDALSTATLSGRVESFAPGSGSQFSLLPFEPGTGNFTKIPQRVPVRIRFNSGQSTLAQLRPGLSTTVTVSFRGQP